MWHASPREKHNDEVHFTTHTHIGRSARRARGGLRADRAANGVDGTAAKHAKPAQNNAKPAPANDQKKTSKPNILVIFGDDIGQTNISAYGQGVVGYQTPNIDRIAKEGMLC